MTITKITRALISVSDKTGLVELAAALHRQGVVILSTGGTAKALRDAHIPIAEVGDYTGFPEMMDGRVKTLHPKVHGGILQVRGNEEHAAAAAQHAIPPIDLVVVNLYPFAATVAKGADFETCIENIDIGGPALIRAAAKNHAAVTIITDPSQYKDFLQEFEAHQGSTLALRRRYAQAAFAHTSCYDGMINHWFGVQAGQDYPPVLTLAAELKQSLRYGENPHQTAAFYVTGEKTYGLADARKIQGKELSYNNINDTDAAWDLVSEFTDSPAVAIIKHANPCGVAIAADLATAYQHALQCDQTSAFGGIIACNRILDAATAQLIAEIFTEVIIAPDATDDAQAIIATKKNLRLLLTGGLPQSQRDGRLVKSINGGYLVQNRDALVLNDADLRCVTKKRPTAEQWQDLRFAFTVAKHVKSNTIVYAKRGATVGIGAGQMSRVDAARIAARKAEDAAKALGLSVPLTAGCVVASDAFFPFADGLLAAVEAGATAVIQPGGSMRDDEVIKAADDAGLAMVMTGIRHFRH